MINTNKLHQELVLAGILIDGVADTIPPRIDFQAEATAAQRQQALTILAAHIPEDYIDKRQQVYVERGVTTEALIVALWEQVVEGRPEAAATLQTIRQSIKAQFPKSS